MANNNIEILYENDEIIAVNKPTGISVTKDRQGNDGVISILQKQLGTDSPFKLIHPLDKDVSGVMILAKNSDGQSKYASLFAKQQIAHRYLAITEGPLSKPEGIIKSPIARSKVDDEKMVISPRRGKETITKWAVVADFGSVCLLTAEPLTIRTHQVRVHLKSIGAPLTIDPLYASKEGLFLSRFKLNYRLAKSRQEKPLIERLTLHSYKIIVPQTESTERAVIIAPLDKKFKAAIKMLTKYSINQGDAFAKESDYERILAAQELL